MRSRLVPVSLIVLLVACSSPRGAAEKQLEAAQQAVAGLAADARDVVPDQVAALEEAITAGSQAIESGDYPSATESLAGVPGLAKALVDSLPAQRASLRAEMDTLTVVVPRNLTAIQTELDRIGKGGKLPGGLDRKGLDQVRQINDSSVALWRDVQAEFQSGKLADAMAKAHDLKARVSQALQSLGLVADERAWSNVTLPPR